MPPRQSNPERRHFIVLAEARGFEATTVVLFARPTPIQLDDYHTQQHPAYYARSRLKDHICKTSHKAVYKDTIVCGIAQSTIPRINCRLLPSSTTRNDAQDYLHHHPRYHKQ
jgi:hypothetical protein